MALLRPAEQISTQHLLLRRVEPDLVEQWCGIAQREHGRLSKFLDWPNIAISPRGTSALLKTYAEEWEMGTDYCWGVYKKESPQVLVGAVEAHSINRELATAQLGYWNTQASSGKGIITQALAQGLEPHLTACGFTTLFIHAHTENTASQALAKRLGYQNIKTLQLRKMSNQQEYYVSVFSKMLVDALQANNETLLAR